MIGGRPKVDQKKLRQAIASHYSKRFIQEGRGISRATLYGEIRKEQTS